MAVRKISTRLAIEGEAEYRAAISRINSELKAQKSALELVEAQYKANSSSTEALSAKSDALNKMLATQREKQEQLEAVIRNALATEEKLQKRKVELTRELEKNQREMERLKSSSEDTNAEQNSLTETEKKLTAELEQTEQAIAKVHNKTNGWETQLNQTQTAVVELETAVKENNAALSNAEKEPGKLQKAFARLGVGAEEGKEGVTALAAALAAQKLPEAFYKIKDALMECVIASEEFESAMAGVKKTTDLSDEELTDLGNRFRTLSTEIPITATELAGIAESAGQLGIQKDSLEDFTVTMANLGVATNMTSEEAATMLARFANVTGMDAEKYENLGSVIVALGNNFATTETEITEMAQRVAAAGRLAGLTEPEILALAASMSSVGIQAEAGGTAMTQTLTAIEKAVTSGGEKLESFAAISGMSAEQFSSVWKSAPAEAIESFITGLGQLDEKGKSATTALDDLGLSGIRQSNMLKSMSQASDLMSRAMETANGAWEENTALAKEAATRYETTESKFQMFKNSVDNLKVAIGDQLNPALGNLAEVGTDAVSWATDFIEKNEWLGPVILGIVSALGVLTVGLSGFAIAIKIVIPLIHSFNDAMSMNVLGVTALAIGGVITAITALSRAIQKDNPELEEMTSAARELNDTLENGKKAYEDNIANIEVSANVAEKYIGQLEALEEAGLRTNEQQRAYHGILQQLCDTVPELAQYIDLENNTIEGGTAALRRNTEEWRENAKAKAYQDKLTEVYKAQAEVQYELTLNETKRTEAVKRKTEAEAGLAQAEERLAGIQEQLNEAAEKGWNGDKNAADSMADLQDQYEQTEQQIRDYVHQIEDASQEAEIHAEALEADNEALENASTEAEAAEKAYDELTKSQNKNTASSEENAEAQAAAAEAQEEVRQKIEDLAEEYKRVYDEAYNSISGQTGLFGEFAAEISEDTNTAEKMMDRWAAQTRNLENYTRNLKLAAQYGIDEGLLQSLSDGSAESAGYLQTIIDKYTELGANADTTKEQIETSSGDLKDFHDKFNTAFKGTEDAKNAFATTVTDMSESLKTLTSEAEKAAKEVDFSGFREALQEAISGKGLDYQVLGAEMSEGLAAGITEKSDEAKSAAKSVGQEVQESLMEGLGSGGDSSGAKETGKSVSQDLQSGIEEGREGVSSAVEDTGEEIQTGMKNAGKQAVKEFDDEFSKGTEKARQRVSELKEAISIGFSDLPGKMRTIGEQSIDGMIAGIDNRSSALYAKVSDVVNDALESARAAADTHSPSKKTIKIFEDVGDGMVVGLENKRSKLQATMESVINSAIKMESRETAGDALKGMEIPPSCQRAPNPAPSGTRYQIGDIHVEIHAETDDPDKLYREFTTRLKRDVEKEMRSKRG